jgi:hypothetical protein
MTTIKSILLAAAIGVSTLTFASAQTFNIQLNSATAAGNTQLAAGSYKLNLSGRIATFTNVETSKSVMVMVRQGSSSQMFERNAIELKNENGVKRLESIQLEDSSSTLEF